MFTLSLPSTHTPELREEGGGKNTKPKKEKPRTNFVIFFFLLLMVHVLEYDKCVSKYLKPSDLISDRSAARATIVNRNISRILQGNGH